MYFEYFNSKITFHRLNSPHLGHQCFDIAIKRIYGVQEIIHND